MSRSCPPDRPASGESAEPHPLATMRARHARIGSNLVWLGFIAIPVASAAVRHGSGLNWWLTLLGAVAFSAGYTVFVIHEWDGDSILVLRVTVTVQFLLAVALTTIDGQGWGYLFCYVAACVALVTPSPGGFAAVLLVTVAGAGATFLGGGNDAEVFSYGISTIGVGVLLVLMRDLRARNRELSGARAELARTAVVAERERFARDLHDLLGHSLSVIAIKAELAGRLLPAAPDRAAAEVADLESVARSALTEVREAVSGYRRPTLDGELEGARVALAAAGILAEFKRAPLSLAPEVEAVLAWAVREGATNVIRHSGARRCEVRVQARSDGARVEVLDDGSAADGHGPVNAVADPGAGSGGNGLAGLRERAAAVRGQLEAGALAEGGYRLEVVVPAGAATAAEAGL